MPLKTEPLVALAKIERSSSEELDISSFFSLEHQRDHNKVISPDKQQIGGHLNSLGWGL